MEILSIPLSQITPSPFNRKVVKDQELKELAESIKANGVLEPLTVRKNLNDAIVSNPDRLTEASYGSVPYELVFGERRYRAALLAGVDKVPCQVIEADDLKVLQLQYEENKHRTNPNPLDIAENFFHARTLGKSEKEIAKLYGVSSGYVYGLLNLQRASDNIREAVRTGEITASHAEVLIPLDEKQATNLLSLTIGNGWSVRGLQDRVKQVTHKATAKARKPETGNRKPDPLQWQFNVASRILKQINSFGQLEAMARIKKLPLSELRGMLSNYVVARRLQKSAITKLAKQYRVDVAKIKRELSAKNKPTGKPAKSPRGDKRK